MHADRSTSRPAGQVVRNVQDSMICGKYPLRVCLILNEKLKRLLGISHAVQQQHRSPMRTLIQHA